ncbi:MAG TPA: glycerophosphodiester phosphodiesterase family protein, partial [Cytophagaceae bacterium]
MKVSIATALVLIYSFLTSCKEVDPSVIKNLNNGNIWVIGHAGIGMQTGRNPIPSNSEQSIQKAIEAYNADGSEVDIQLSKDSILVLFHDDFMDQRTDCFGCINEKNYDEINSCKYHKDFAVNSFREEPVIAFEHILEKYKNTVHKPLLFLDIKIFESCNQKTPEYIRRFTMHLVRVLLKYDLSERAFIETDDEQFIKNIRMFDTERRLKILKSASGDDYEVSK